MKDISLPVWLIRSLASQYEPVEAYEELILNCSDEEINILSRWMARFMREFDDALLDV